MSRTYDGLMRREWAEKADDGPMKLEETHTTLDGFERVVASELVRVRVTVETLGGEP